MLDNTLHTLLAFAVASLVYALSLWSPYAGAWAAGSLLLFFRELTQIQTNSFHDDFRYGWDRNFTHWNHFSEWFLPSAVLGMLTVIIAFYWNLPWSM